jgi:hypothetical protein
VTAGFRSISFALSATISFDGAFHSSWRSAGAARPPRAASINTVRKSITPAARGLGIDVRLYEVRSGIELEPALAAAVRDGVQALYMSEAPHLLVLRGRRWRTCGYRRCTHSGNTCNPAGAGWTLGREAAESPSAAVPGLSRLCEPDHTVPACSRTTLSSARD